jgi:hypothetical protein
MNDSPRLCYEGCFHYDPDKRGCTYNSGDFEATETVYPGNRCLHPEFDESQIMVLPIGVLCAVLDPDQSSQRD